MIGSDAPSDLALRKTEAIGLPVLPLGNSDKVRVGDMCLAVGNPLGIGETVTAGILSARGRATGLSDGSFEYFSEERPIHVRLVDLDKGAADTLGSATQGERLGFSVAPLTPDSAARLRLPRGTPRVVVVSVDPSGPAVRGAFSRMT